MTYYARKDQTLPEHIEKTANLAKMFAAIFGCGNTAYLAGLLHDLGKYTLAFQDYLERSLRGEDVTRGEVIHALQGAKFAAEIIKDPVIADIIGNVIATHHSGLFDIITDGERTLTVKTNKSEDRLHYGEAKRHFSHAVNEAELKTEILSLCRTSLEKKLSLPFMLHLMTKALYSCLVDADRCDAAGIELNDTPPDWAELIRQLENYLAGFSNKSA